MKRQLIRIFFLTITLLPCYTPQVRAAEGSVALLFFYEAGCPHCARIERFLEERIKPNYPVTITRYEIHDPDNALLLQRFADYFNTEVFTPSVVVGDTLIKGDERQAIRAIEKSVREALENNASSPLLLIQGKEALNRTISITALLSAAAVDAINPCACAVLVILLGTILVGRRSRRQVIRAGLAFTTSTLVSYLAMGMGLFYAINITGIQSYIYIVVSLLAIGLGLGNLKDFIWPRKWFSMGVPQSWRPRIQQIASGVTSVPGAFGIGFLVSVFLLPCTSGPYIVVIGMLSNNPSKITVLGLLLLYNLIFVLPFILITLGVGFGLTTTARIEMLRKKKLRGIHLITGLIMLAIGLGLIILVIAGKV